MEVELNDEMIQKGTDCEAKSEVVTKSIMRGDVDNVSYKSSKVVFYIQIAFFAICGCLGRIGTDLLFGNLANIEDSGEIINLSFFSNMLGSFVLGALHSSALHKSRLISLCKGLATGFCGSFTTWSKWNQQLSLLLIGETSAQSQPQVSSILGWFVGFYCFIGSYSVGSEFGRNLLQKRSRPLQISHNAIKRIDAFVAGLFIFSLFGFSLGVAFDQVENQKKIWLAVLFAPFGACLRYSIAHLTHERLKLPIGTFLANFIGAVGLASIHVINVRVANSACDATYNLCWPTMVTYAVGTGFAACLTTISTFVGEFYKLRPEHPKFAYFYVLLTVVLCQLVCGIINGVNFAIPVKQTNVTSGITPLASVDETTQLG